MPDLNLTLKTPSELTNTATSFASDDVIAVDSPTSGSRQMPKDSLLKECADNCLASIHNLPTTITAFRTGDVIPVDGPRGTAKMSKEVFLGIIAETSKTETPAIVEKNYH